MPDVKDTLMTAPPSAVPWSSSSRPESDPAPQGAFVHVAGPKDAQGDRHEPLHPDLQQGLEAALRRRRVAAEQNTER